MKERRKLSERQIFLPVLFSFILKEVELFQFREEIELLKERKKIVENHQTYRKNSFFEPKSVH